MCVGCQVLTQHVVRGSHVIPNKQYKILKNAANEEGRPLQIFGYIICKTCVLNCDLST